MCLRVRAQDNWLKLASEFIIFSTIMVALTQHTGTAHQDVFDDVLMVLYAGLLPVCTAATVACKVRRSRDDGAHVSLNDVGAALARYGNGMLDDAGRELLQTYLGKTRETAREQRQRWETHAEPVRIS